MNTKPVVFLDLDSSLADYDLAAIAGLNNLRSPDEPLIVDLKIDSLPPHLEQRRHLITRQTGWWRALRPITEGMQLAGALAHLDYRLVVLSRGPRGKNFAWSEKKDWCDNHLGHLDHDVIICTTKDVMVGEILYDDWPPYFEGWLVTNPAGLVIMRDTPSNQGYVHPQVVRLTPDNLTDVLARVASHRQGRSFNFEMISPSDNR